MARVGVIFGDETFEVYHDKYGLILNDSTYVAWDNKNKTIVKWGNDAKKLKQDITNSYEIVKLFNLGEINNLEKLSKLFEKIFIPLKKYFENEEVVIGYPCDLKPKNKQVIQDLFNKLEPKTINLVPNIHLLALGLGINVKDTYGTILLNFGYSRTSGAIIADNKIVNFKSINFADDYLNENISMFFKEQYQLIVDLNQINNIKYGLASLASSGFNELQILVQGKDLLTNESRKIVIHDSNVKKIFNSLFSHYRSIITNLLEGSPTAIRTGIAKNGLILTGKLIKIHGISNYFNDFFEFPVKIIEEKVGINDALKGSLIIDLN